MRTQVCIIGGGPSGLLLSQLLHNKGGDTVGLEGLLDEAVRNAARVVAENDDAKPDGPELSADARARIAERSPALSRASTAVVRNWCAMPEAAMAAILSSISRAWISTPARRW